MFVCCCFCCQLWHSSILCTYTCVPSWIDKQRANDMNLIPVYTYHESSGNPSYSSIHAEGSGYHSYLQASIMSFPVVLFPLFFCKSPPRPQPPLQSPVYRSGQVSQGGFRFVSRQHGTTGFASNWVMQWQEITFPNYSDIVMVFFNKIVLNRKCHRLLLSWIAWNIYKHITKSWQTDREGIR